MGGFGLVKNLFSKIHHTFPYKYFCYALSNVSEYEIWNNN